MGDTQQTTQASTTAPSNPAVSSAITKLMNGLQTAQDAGPTYTAPGATTIAGQNASLSAAGNPAFTQGLGSAYGNVNSVLGNGGLTAGQTNNMNDTNSLASLYKQMALDPSKTQQGQNLINSVKLNTDSAFNNSGLFGSDNNQTALSRGLTEGLGNLQQGYLTGQQGANNDAFSQGQQGVSNSSSLAQLLPSLYNAGQMPSGTQQAVGSAQDTNTQNAANKQLTLLSQLSQIGGLSAGSAGTNTTSTTTSPTQNPLLALLGLGASAL